MSPEAEELLKELINKKNDEGYVSEINPRTLSFQELEESKMFSKIQLYNDGGGYIRLSSKALNYFSNKEAVSKEKQQEKQEDMVSKRQAWIMSIISGIIVGFVVTLINQLFK